MPGACEARNPAVITTSKAQNRLGGDRCAHMAARCQTYVSGRAIRNPTVRVLQCIAVAIGMTSADLLAYDERTKGRSDTRVRKKCRSG